MQRRRSNDIAACMLSDGKHVLEQSANLSPILLTLPQHVRWKPPVILSSPAVYSPFE